MIKPYFETNGGKLYHGDCLKIMRNIKSASIDSLITDPPYGLNFMGKKWDYDVPSVKIWQECLRVLKPGAHALIFAGSRTQHRMAVNVEDAGFILKDCLMWLYGCLSEDTEILTSEGWKHYHKAIESNLVLCYDKALNEFVFDKPTNSFCYENQHAAYHIKSDSTDQIVSTNHRCLIERERKLIFQRAEELQSEENIPFLDSLRDLPKAISDLQSDAIIKKNDLLQKVQLDENIKDSQRQTQKEKTTRRTRTYKTYLLRLQKRILQSHLLFKKGKRISLFKKMQWNRQGQRMGQTWIQRKRKANKRKLYQRGSKDDRLQKSSMERRHYLSTAKRKLCESINKICSLPARLLNYVQERRLCYGASAFSGSTNRKAAETVRGCSPYQPQRRRQQAEKSDAFREQSSPQEIRRRPGYKTTLATITPIEYKGKIWCIQVSTGAFVARRNGKIFITGNSGFPKSTDISKQLDKMAGKERKVIGIRTDGRGRSPQKIDNHDKGDTGIGHADGSKQIYQETAPATPEAGLWNGWGTHLKPSYEPILLAMKPNDGTYGQNAFKHGVAGLNIEGGRIKGKNLGIRNRKASSEFGQNSGWSRHKNKDTIYDGTKGRFPANVIFDEEAAVLLDKQSGVLKSGAIKPHYRNQGSETIGTFKIRDRSGENNISSSQGGASRFFYTAKASPAERGKNNHPTVKPLKLMEYLCNLTKTPTGGTVLDPFAGSGTTAVACHNTGRPWILIEREEKYCKTAAARIEAETAQIRF
jgi:site-specific DNA-methyltransferase (adenine-specific)